MSEYRELETVVWCHTHRQVHAKEPTNLNGKAKCGEYDWRALYVKRYEDSQSSPDQPSASTS